MNEKRMDTANEPIDHDEFMDTGVLHETYPPCTDGSCSSPHHHHSEKKSRDGDSRPS